jgi:hypothetical protein
MNEPVDFYVGVDLGQMKDYTAIAVIEEPVWIGSHNDYWQAMPTTEPGWVSPTAFSAMQTAKARVLACEHGRPGRPDLHVSHLERYELGTPYPLMIERITALMNRPPLAGRSTLLVDATGVGLPVVDALRDAGLDLEAVTITGGGKVTPVRGGWHVPKRDLIASAQIALQARRLIIAEGLPHTATLVKELQDYRVEISEATGHDSYNARSGAHDDLVLAVALAVWNRDHVWWHWDRQAEAIGRPAMMG